MKKTVIAMGVLMAAAMSTSSYAAKQGAGTINFTGEIIAETCKVDINGGGANPTINMGKIASSSFEKTGDTADARRIEISLTDCTVAGKAAASFSGSETGSGLLDLKDSGVAGVASGVAIEFLNRKMTPVKLSTQPEESDFVEIEDKKATLLYMARYKSTADTVVAGKADAVADYTIVYQ